MDGSTTPVRNAFLESDFDLRGYQLLNSGGVGQGSFGAQNANKVYAGPASGADALPAFRLLVPADYPLAQLTSANLDVWSNATASSLGLNLVSMVVPGVNSYVKINTFGVPSYLTPEQVRQDLNARLDDDVNLDAIAALNSAADSLPYFTGVATAAVTAFTATGRTVVGAASLDALKETLAVDSIDNTLDLDKPISTLTQAALDGKQAVDATLTALAAVVTAADRLIYATADDVFATADFSAAGRTLVAGATAAIQRASLGLIVGTDVQAWEADLAALAGLVSAADKLPYFTGAGTAALATFTAAGRALMADADAAAQLVTLGLDDVDNTRDIDKPVSIATQTALDLKQNTSEKNQVSGYAGLDGTGKISSSQIPAISPTDVFTVASQAAQLALDASAGDFAIRTDTSEVYVHNGGVAGTMADWSLISIAGAVFSVAGKTGTVTLVKGDVGLADVDNTSDTTKPISTATQAALDAKQPLDDELTALAGLASAADKLPYFTGAGAAALTVFTAAGRALVDDADVAAQLVTLGLGNVTNTSDANKPVSNAQQTALNLKANLASPTFTGTVAAAAVSLSGNLTVAGSATIAGATFHTGTQQVIIARLPATSNYTQIGFQDPSAVQRGYISYFGSTFGGGRSDHFEIGTVVGTSLYFRPGAAASDSVIFDANGDITALGRLIVGSGATILTDAAGKILANAHAGGTLGTAAYTAATAYQAIDAEITALAGLVSAADKLPYFTGAGTAALTTFTAAGRALMDDADAAAQLVTLGLDAVDNTSDVDKPISTAVESALAAKVNSNSPLSLVVMSAKASDATAILPILLYVKNVEVLTAGEIDTDIATIALPAGITRWRLGGGNTVGTAGGTVFAETAAGTLAAASFTAFTAAGGTGLTLTAAAPGPAAASTGSGWQSVAASTISTSSTIYIRQTADSANTGTISFYLLIHPLL